MKQPSYTLHRCSECDSLVSVPEDRPNQTACCPHCDEVLQSQGWGLDRCTMIALSILILLPFTFVFPLMSIDLLGVPIHATIWGGAWKMATEGYHYTAFLVLFCSIIMPLTFALLVISLRLQRLIGHRPRYTLILLAKIQEWVMLDVYLVALAVAAFKIHEYATLTFNIYLIAFVITTILTTLLFAKLNIPALWAKFYPEYHPLSADQICSPTLCSTCSYTFDEQIIDLKGQQRCPRCESKLNTPHSVKLQRVWACLLAGAIMMIPANVLPISAISLAGSGSADTLMSGVLSFIALGSYAVAAIVFIASIFVPLSKIAIILYLLLAIHFRWNHSIHRQIKLLHFVHFVGRWSMLDLFVLALMMSLLERGQILNFSVGDAAFYFGCAVFLTMIASNNLDAKMLWELHHSHDKRSDSSQDRQDNKKSAADEVHQ